MTHYPYRQRDQATTEMKELVVTGDFTAEGNFTFGNAALDSLVLNWT